MDEPGPSAIIARPSTLSQVPIDQVGIARVPPEQQIPSLPSTIYNTSNISGGTIHNVRGDFHSNHYYRISPVASVNHPVSRPPPSLPPFNDAPIDRISSCFTGREAELDFITTSFITFQSDKPTRFVIYGMPGLGKSQLALQHANLAFTARTYSRIFWVPASTMENLAQGLVRLLVLINHADRSHPDQAVQLAAVRLWFEQSDRHGCLRWLFILDSVTVESVKFLREHLPRQNAGGAILITTRTRNVAESVANVAGQEHLIFELKALSKEDSVSLLLKKAQIQTTAPTDLASAEKLVSRIGCLPLAVEQAGSYMKRSGLKNANQLQRMYDERGLKEVISWQNNLTTYEETSVLATFTLQLQKLDEIDPHAHRLLKMLAFFDPENIPIDILSLGARSIKDRLTKIVEPSLSILDPLQGVSLELRALIELLCSEERVRATFIHFEDLSVARPMYGERPALHIHDLIQWVLQQSTILHREEGYRALAIALLCNAFQTITDPRSPQSWDECEVFVPHFTALGTQDQKYSVISEEYMVTNESISVYLVSRGRYSEAKTLLDRVLAHRRRLLGPKDMGTAHVMHSLAEVNSKLGRYEEAESLYLPVLAAQEKQLEADHPCLLTTVHNLALLYESQGSFDQAESSYGRALAGRERQLGADHPKTLVTVNSLAGLCVSQGKFDEAESLFTRALEGQEKHIGADHSDTLMTVNNLAVLYESQGKFDKAESLYARALEGQEKQLGADHPDTLATVHNLALLYKSQGKLEDAESLYGRVLVGEERQLGVDHPSTLATISNLASLYKSQGRFDEAESLYVRALEGQEKQLGADHPDKLATTHNLALLYKSQGKLEEAESLYGRVLVGEERQLGVDHPSTLMTISNLASLYKSQGRFDEAESWYVRALEGQEKQLGSDHPDTHVTLGNLVRLLDAQGRHEEGTVLRERMKKTSL
ncbi:TPR-like protein [Athelia psychrophila]|uniref:TPR-like protein n=1 Tax=Athelia psychrophila TaxID=1759441 RepID=A0A166R4S1_9AGAM|nr:TPR-like protein [Fibularhizoctonia sp. CBS 109695]